MTAPRIALKVDVDTYRGTQEGVPRLVQLLLKHKAQATFLFSLGPDHTGRAIKRVFRPGFFSKVSRTSVVEHYGIKTLLYGTLLPGPHIGKKCAGIMRDVRHAGFEVGVHTFDHIRWQDEVAGKGKDWTVREFRLATSAFHDVFGDVAKIHGAAGWQMNPHAFRQELLDGMEFCSDTRGTHPFIPVVDGVEIDCPQLPTTLPTLDELIGVDAITEHNVHQKLMELAGKAAENASHVYTLHAELEGQKLAFVFERLLLGLTSLGFELVSLGELYRGLDKSLLPRHAVTVGEIPGRTGTLSLQGTRLS